MEMVEKMKAMLKMFWMIYWRLNVLSFSLLLFNNGEHMFSGPFGMFVVSVIASILLYKAGIELHTHPVRRIFNKLPLYKRISGSVATKPKWDYPTKEHEDRGIPGKSKPHFAIQRNVQKRAVNRGRLSGYENNILGKMPLPKASCMYGVPGAGLNAATQQFGEKAVEMGQKGEENFAKALRITNSDGLINTSLNLNDSLLNKITSFWSVSIPTAPGEKDYNTDVDCILANGNKMLLIDLKYYSDGDVTYYSDGERLYTVDNQTNNWVGLPKKMSKNMSLALNRFKKKFPNYEIEAMTILVPTAMGIGKFASYPYMPTYEGNIPLYNINYAMMKISSFFERVYYSESYNKKDFFELKSLLRGGSISQL